MPASGERAIPDPAAPVAVFDRSLLRRRRDRAAAAGNVPVFLVEAVAGDLAERIAALRRSFGTALVIGAPEPLLRANLAATGRFAAILGADLSAAALRGAAGPVLALDEERLPFGRASLGCIVSALTLHWVNDLPGALIQMRRALKPGGLFLGALLGGATLAELRAALLASELETVGGAAPRVAPFLDAGDAAMLLQRAGFARPVVDTDRLRVRYADVFSLLRDLKAMGARNVMRARSAAPLRRATVRHLATHYAETFEDGAAGRMRATFEILYLTGWAPE
jgi:NADH dehydrogenase [ubiquinone] 1 alpha subcomplex assembly factor 5